MSTPDLSVIIPTRDRPGLLRDALRSLMVQTTADFEVVVVDDGSEPGLEPVVRSVAGPVPVRYHRQAPAGLNVGRNTGATVARGEILAYLDDDVIVAPGWAAALRAAFSTVGCAAVAGRIRLWFEHPEPRWFTPELRSYLSELDLGDTGGPLPFDRLPYGANCAVARTWFERVGGFRAGLDRNGTSLISNGDTEFFARVRDAGGAIRYCADAAVLHRVPPDRLTPEWFRRRARAQGVSDVLVDAGTPRAQLARLAVELARGTLAVAALAKGLVNGAGPRNASLWLDYTRGQMAAIRGRS